MRRWQKLVTTIWSTLLAAPLLWACFAFWRMECSELDPCPTGGPMPRSGAALALLTAIVMVQGAFLLMIWKRVPEREDP